MLRQPHVAKTQKTRRRDSLCLLRGYLVKVVLVLTTQCRLLDEELVRIRKDFAMCQLMYYLTFGKPRQLSRSPIVTMLPPGRSRFRTPTGA